MPSRRRLQPDSSGFSWEREIQALTPDQARMLLEAARGDRLETLYVLAVSAGLRQGELLGLRWADVDLGRGTLQVRQQLTRTRAGLSFTSPKGDKSRSVRLTLPRRLPFRIVRTLRRSSTLCGPCFRDLPSAGSSSAVS